MNDDLNAFLTRLNFALKRAFDIIIAGTMLALFAPTIILIAVWMKYRSPGPVFFSHQRIGLNGRPFQCLKFRTMRTDAEAHLQAILNKDPILRAQWERHRKLDDDPRIIPGIGNFLRNSSLDELPQLWNILVGDMSMVGPRPVTKAELPNYGNFVGHYLAVRPGLTGLWQIGGRSEISYADRVLADVEYVDTSSITTDIKIFVKTVVYFVTGRLTGGR
jgi:lipopolysaccharide/colanic/teichoic acid biosynthesis glycosyltransferase